MKNNTVSYPELSLLKPNPGVKMKRYFLVIILTILSAVYLYPCTTAVVSGSATDDGRPLLLKNRDADALQNRLVYFSEGKFRFIGLVNSEDRNNKEVWVGFNSAGFGIMNSASYNLKGNDTIKLADLEGVIMKLALSQCATLEDFENLLNDLPKPLGVEANFGVIDANGGAAYYETNNFTFIKYDVNDPEVAPEGYLIRTNYSFAGSENKGFGYIRYATASKLFTDRYSKEKISFDFLVSDVPRCLSHSYTKVDLTRQLPLSAKDVTYVPFRDYIPRYFSSAAIVVQGIKEEEDPSLTTMWSIVGFPLTSVIVPVWLLEDGSLPKILQADNSGNSQLSTLALQLKDKVFPKQNDARENYINVAALMNKEGTGIRQKLIPIEGEVLEKAKEKLDKWRSTHLNETEVKEFYSWIDEYLIKEIKSRLE
jgi:hypothetical protein